MKAKKFLNILLALVVIAAALLACNTTSAPGVAPQAVDPSLFRLVANSDVKTLDTAGIFNDFASSSGIKLNIVYKGSVDIKNAISALAANNPKTVDAYWPGSSLQIPISPSVTPVSIMKSYVVLTVDSAVADSLGWNPSKGVAIADLIDAVKAEKVHLAMTSASQSNSGQTFYIALLTGLCGKNVLTPDCLQKTEVTDGIKTLLAGVDCKNSSTGFLKDSFIKDTIAGSNKCNAMVTYESEAIDTNKQLIAAGKSPLLVFYVNGATAIADEPLMYVDNGDAGKLDQYNKFVAYLETPEVQAKIQSLGWRTGQIGMALPNADKTVFNPVWGIDTTTDFPLMAFPKAGTTSAAIDLYQTTYRKPSYTLYCLDNSSSMDGNGGHGQMTDAMDLLLDQNRASVVQLQVTSKDVTVVYAFSNSTQEIGTVTGNDPATLKSLSNQISQTDLGGNTALFDCLSTALDYAGSHYDASYAWEIIAMTDGGSNWGISPETFVSRWQAFTSANGYTVPVYSIAFGDADLRQLDVLKATGGSVCVGTQGGDALVKCFRDAKGNN